MPANRNVTSIETFTGRYVDLLDPQPEQITLEDIAVGLSNTARFGGQLTRFYSVAEHAVRVSYEVPAELALGALHHDSHEFVLGDIIAPLKAAMGRVGGREGLEALAMGLDRTIAAALGFPEDLMHDPRVKAADDEVMYREAALLKHSHGTGHHWLNDVVRTPWAGMGWSPARAERKFYERHLELTNG